MSLESLSILELAPPFVVGSGDSGGGGGGSGGSMSLLSIIQLAPPFVLSPASGPASVVVLLDVTLRNSMPLRAALTTGATMRVRFLGAIV